MGILIFAETDDKGKFKKDAFEIASFAFEIGTDLNKEVTALCFNATNPEKLSAYGVKKVINSNNTKLKDFDPEIYSECICEIFDNENCNTLILSSSSNSKYIGGILS